MSQADQDGRGLASAQTQHSTTSNIMTLTQPATLLKIARELEVTGDWRLYLTEQEHVLFKKAIDAGGDEWIEFIEIHSIDDEESTNTFAKNENSSAVFTTTALRTREMLFEQIIPHMWMPDDACCKPRIDFNRLVGAKPALSNSSLLPPSSNTTASNPPQDTQMVEDDDYDEPDQVEDGKISDSAIAENANPPTQSEDHNSTEQNKVNQPASSDAPQPPHLISNLPSLGNEIKIPLYDMYHTIEYDADAMRELLRLEESDRRNQDDNDNENEKDTATDAGTTDLQSGGEQPMPKSAGLNFAQFGDANLSMKYLLNAIDQRRQKTVLSDRELKVLLSDVRPNRSKWASDDKVGQEELYDAAERVVIALRNYTEHSFPFLSKVSKRDAPDYYDVIKNPMDLGTVMRKLKAFGYKNKKQFVDDINLIWANCLTYNSDPAHAFRKHAIAMKKKAQTLLTYVPDVSVRDRAEVEAEEDALAEADGALDEESEEEKPTVKSSRKAPGSKKGAGKKASSKAPTSQAAGHEEGMPNGHADGTSVTNGVERAESAKPGREQSGTPRPNGVHTAMLSTGAALSRTGTPAEMQDENDSDLEKEEEDISAQIDADAGDLQFQMWKELTKATRARAAIQAHKYSSTEYVFGDQEAIRRTAADMKRFLLTEGNHNRLDAVLINAPTDTTDEPDNLVAKPGTDDEALYLPQYAVASGVPDILNYDPNEVNIMLDDQFSTKQKLPKLHQYEEVAFPSLGLNPLIDNTIEKLKQVRDIGNKCQAAKNPYYMPPMEMEEDKADIEGNGVVEEEEVILDANAPPFNLNDECAALVGEKVVAKVLAHVGFEASQVNAFDTMTDVFGEIMMNFGKTLRMYMDRQHEKMKPEEMTLHTLLENGIEDVGDLESYIKDDIVRMSSKLGDLQKKLETAFQEIMYGANEGEAIEEDALFDREEEFVTGNFTEEMGEDFFGFKELGLDKELGMVNLSVPMRLFHGRPGRAMPFATANAVKEKPPQYPPPPPFDAFTAEDVEEQIGLLRDFFRQKIADGTDGHIVEDENLPPKTKPFRPKVPPSGKIATPKKKPSTAGANDAKKKKPAQPVRKPSGAGNDKDKDKDKDISEEPVKKTKPAVDLSVNVSAAANANANVAPASSSPAPTPTPTKKASKPKPKRKNTDTTDDAPEKEKKKTKQAKKAAPSELPSAVEARN